MYNVIFSKSFYVQVLTASILILFTTFLYGQEKNDSKLDKVEGNVEKITIKTDKGTFTFEGNDAKDLFKNMGFSKTKSFKFFNSGDNCGNKVKIKVENKDGEKVATVTTTNKDGEEQTEIYKGKEADEFLHKKGINKFKLMRLDENDKDGVINFLKKIDEDDADIMIWKTDDSTNGMENIIKVTEENGEKIVTVTSKDKDGKVKTETYRGKDADDYLKKNDMKLKIKVEGDKDGKVQEIIIKKK